MSKKKKIVINVIVIVIILVIAIALLLVINNTRKVGAQVVVRVDGKEVAKYDLSIDGTYVLNGGTNVLQIKNGEACLIEANCPDQLCVNFGKIKYTGQTITCLPNKLTVTVIGNDGFVELE